ncbi:hypothetical protein [Halorussus pelagicus]|uniref:hypothetical protein n=1 Tax=Halorussus pelagicus TaxID=2505977 RepID=UPI000FFC7BDF|nr:hypothetical protein [Halorussus pelagicus]
MADYDPDAKKEQQHAREHQRERTESVEDMLGDVAGPEEYNDERALGELDAETTDDESSVDAN